MYHLGLKLNSIVRITKNYSPCKIHTLIILYSIFERKFYFSFYKTLTTYIQ
nr:MAG TPA: hypothetical protein [Caudoviricetes sp.]